MTEILSRRRTLLRPGALVLGLALVTGGCAGSSSNAVDPDHLYGSFDNNNDNNMSSGGVGPGLLEHGYQRRRHGLARRIRRRDCWPRTLAVVAEVVGFAASRRRRARKPGVRGRRGDGGHSGLRRRFPLTAGRRPDVRRQRCLRRLPRERDGGLARFAP